jgi:predicted transcriptional regulator
MFSSQIQSARKTQQPLRKNEIRKKEKKEEKVMILTSLGARF